MVIWIIFSEYLWNTSLWNKNVKILFIAAVSLSTAIILALSCFTSNWPVLGRCLFLKMCSHILMNFEAKLKWWFWSRRKKRFGAKRWVPLQRVFFRCAFNWVRKRRSNKTSPPPCFFTWSILTLIFFTVIDFYYLIFLKMVIRIHS